jgi:hypothetical protein
VLPEFVIAVSSTEEGVLDLAVLHAVYGRGDKHSHDLRQLSIFGVSISASMPPAFTRAPMSKY